MSTSVKVFVVVFVVAVVGATAVLWSAGGDGDDAARGAVLTDTHGGGAMSRPVPDAPDAGSTRLAPDAAGPAPSAITPQPTAPSRETSQAPASAPERRAALSGRVVDEGGRPVQGAEVTFMARGVESILFDGSRDDGDEAEDHGHGQDGADTRAQRNPVAKTGADGRFALDVTLPPPPPADEAEPLRLMRNDPTLVVVHASFATLVHEAGRLEPGAVDVGDLVVAAGAWVSGRAVDERGAPVAGATVTARNLVDNPRGIGLPFLARTLGERFNRAVTGADGRFVVRGLHAGGALATAHADGKRPARSERVELRPHAGADVGDLVLRSGEVIAGYVLDEAGEPVPGARVSVSRVAHIVLGEADDVPEAFDDDYGQRAETDERGWFELAGLSGGTYAVHAQADGFGGANRPNVQTGLLDLRLYLPRLGAILLSLRSARDGAPVDGARIVARRLRAGAWGPLLEPEPLEVLAGAEALAAAGRPDDDPAGVYLLQGAGPDGTEITVIADGFAGATVAGPAVTSGAVVPFRVGLVAETVIAGRVVDEEGRPIAGATVRASEPEPDDGFVDHGDGRREVRRIIGGPEDGLAQLRSATTGSDGRFEIRALQPGAWELTARAEGRVPSDPLPLVLADGEARAGLELTLALGGSIAGTVRESDGEPIAGMRVRAAPAGGAAPDDDDVQAQMAMVLGGPDGAEQTTTDDDGGYRFDGLAPGRYEVQLVPAGVMRMGQAMMLTFDGAPDDDEEVHVVDVRAGGETRLDLVRPERGAVRGRVLAAGSPVEGVSVSMGDAGSPLPFGQQTARTDRYGAFEFADVDPGRYELSALAPGAGVREEREIEVLPGQTASVDLTFSGATLAGRVVEEGTGAPIAGATVTATRVEPDGGGDGAVAMSFAMITMDDSGGGGGMHMTVGGRPDHVRTDGEGRFELLYMQPGEYQIEVSGAGCVERTVGPIEVPEDLLVDDVAVEVRRGAAIEGVVRSESTGAGLGRTMVQLSGPSVQETTVTGDDGRYAFEGLESGEYTLSVGGGLMGWGMGDGASSGPSGSSTVTVKAPERRQLDLTASGS